MYRILENIISHKFRLLDLQFTWKNSPCSYGFSMVFLWFFYGFPMVFLWFFYGFPMKTSISFVFFFRLPCLMPPGTSAPPCEAPQSLDPSPWRSRTHLAWRDGNQNTMVTYSDLKIIYIVFI